MLLLWQNNVPVCIEVLLCSGKPSTKAFYTFILTSIERIANTDLSHLDCRVGTQKANSVEFSTVPEPGSILLEQWTVSMTYEGGAGNSGLEGAGEGETLVSPPYQISSRSLLQAVRSYLHFSQLAAWYSKSGGVEPRNILVRITIPDEAFSR